MVIIIIIIIVIKIQIKVMAVIIDFQKMTGTVTRTFLSSKTCSADINIDTILFNGITELRVQFSNKDKHCI